MEMLIEKKNYENLNVLYTQSRVRIDSILAASSGSSQVRPISAIFVLDKSDDVTNVVQDET